MNGWMNRELNKQMIANWNGIQKQRLTKYFFSFSVSWGHFQNNKREEWNLSWAKEITIS